MIDTLDVFSYRLPLCGVIQAGGQHHAFREGVCVRLAHGGTFGWGEAAPLPGFSAETVEEVGHALAALRPSLPASAEDLLNQLHPPSARFAVDTAHRELMARRNGWQILLPPGEIRHPFLRLATLSGDGAVAAPGALRDRVLKVKVGNPDWRVDAERVAIAREMVGPRGRIRLDANRRWTINQAGAFLAAVASLEVDFIEEPVSSMVDLEALASENIAVALDETLQEIVHGGCEDGTALVRQALARVPSAAVLVVKPALLGTWSTLIEVYAAAAGAGRRVVVSSAYEAGIGVRALIALAGMNPSDEAAGLDPYNRFEEDVLSPRLSVDAAVVDVASQLSFDRRVRIEALQPWLER